MHQQTAPTKLREFIRPHQGGFFLSVVLAVLSVDSGLIPYFAVAYIDNLLMEGEKSFAEYLAWCIVALLAYLLKSILHGL